MSLWIVFAPLIGALVCGFGWRFIGVKPAMWVATVILLLAMVLAWWMLLEFTGGVRTIDLLPFIATDHMQASWGLRIDRLTLVMFIVVTTVSALVHVYSIGYMAHDPEWLKQEIYIPRFFAYLSFFTFAMLVLVSANNLVQMFVGWEGVGVASYLLIGFYWRRPSANAAAIKAFIVNRVGDFGFVMGIFLTFFAVGNVDFVSIFAVGSDLGARPLPQMFGLKLSYADAIALLLFVGAMGKSAQFLLHTWLADAMEGPTPVSALIHAATMVTAGVFLVCRMSPIIEYAPIAANTIVAVGALTALFAASIGLVQNDLKRVIAYSTCSQLGYMFVAAGVGAYSVAMFHLLTHAFFKALLFLGAGSVIHAMHHVQDLRDYGGLRHKLPLTFVLMLIGTLAITGVGIPLTHIGFAGFLSKDAIIESTFASGAYNAFVLLIVAAAMTAFYSWRLIFMTFYGTPRKTEPYNSAHESPMSMLIPMGVLSIGAVLAGMLWFAPFFGNTAQVHAYFDAPYSEKITGHGNDTHIATHAETKTDSYTQGALFMRPDNHVLDDAHHVAKWVKIAPFFAMLFGFGLAVWFYRIAPSIPIQIAKTNWPLYNLLLNKYYFDELYTLCFVRTARFVGRIFWQRGDARIIDGALHSIALGAVPFFTRLLKQAQSGYIFHYAFALVLGLIVLTLVGTMLPLSKG